MFVHSKLRYTIKEVNGLFGQGPARTYEDINGGKLRTYKEGKRRYTTPEWLDEYAARKKREGLEFSDKNDPLNRSRVDLPGDQ
jgi:hypothetical protein